MLYAANIDGNIHPEEVEVMLEKANESTFKKVNKQFKKMGDVEVLDCIRENKNCLLPRKPRRNSCSTTSALLLKPTNGVPQWNSIC